MIKAIALDDEPLALSLIRSFCAEVDFIELVATFASAAKAMDYFREHDVDLLFLDIQMPGMTGIDFKNALPKQVMVIFTTAFSEYAVEGFNLNALDYLLKPFELDRFKQAANKARDYYELQKDPSLKTAYTYLKVEGSLVKVDFKTIIYLEGVGNYVKVFRENEKPFLTRMSVTEMEEKLAGQGFMRVHRSFIVQVSKVVSLRRKVLNMGIAEISVGTNYMEEIRRMFHEDGV